jgi:hypothetical protein
LCSDRYGRMYPRTPTHTHTHPRTPTHTHAHPHTPTHTHTYPHTPTHTHVLLPFPSASNAQWAPSPSGPVLPSASCVRPANTPPPPAASRATSARLVATPLYQAPLLAPCASRGSSQATTGLLPVINACQAIMRPSRSSQRVWGALSAGRPMLRGRSNAASAPKGR